MGVNTERYSGGASLDKVFFELRYWLENHNVRPDSLTVILNFADAHDAIVFDAEFRRSLEPLMQYTGRSGHLDIRKFEMVGIKARVESPAHSPA